MNIIWKYCIEFGGIIWSNFIIFWKIVIRVRRIFYRSVWNNDIKFRSYWNNNIEIGRIIGFVFNNYFIIIDGDNRKNNINRNNNKVFKYRNIYYK